jgi:hypothetical protein
MCNREFRIRFGELVLGIYLGDRLIGYLDHANQSGGEMRRARASQFLTEPSGLHNTVVGLNGEIFIRPVL